MYRSLAPLVAVALATLLSACCPEDPFSPTVIVDTTIKNPAFLRIVHAAADAPAAATFLNGSIYREALPYLTYRTGGSGRTEARYYPADTASKTIEFRAGGVLASSPIAMESGAFYTAYLYGKEPNYRVLVTRDTVQPDPPNDKLKIRVVNLVPDAPPFDLTMTTSPNDPVVKCLAYGNASPYSTRSSIDFNQPGFLLTDCVTGDTLIEYPSGVLLFFGGVTMTLVVSGELEPSGDDPLISFAAFFENLKDARTGYYGTPAPLRMNLTALRMINLVPTPSWEGLDLGIFDADFQIKYSNQNDGYRRNYLWWDSVNTVPTLTDPGIRPRGYLLFGGGAKGYKYRTERNSVHDKSNENQTPFTTPDSIYLEANQLFTVVVFGPNVNLQGRTAELRDNAPAPGSAAMARLRFFHGEFTQHESKRLRLRVSGVATPLMAYGQAPVGTESIEIPAGSGVLLEVVDDEGIVVHSENVDIVGGNASTVFFAPRTETSGNVVGVVLRPVVDAYTR